MKNRLHTKGKRKHTNGALTQSRSINIDLFQKYSYIYIYIFNLFSYTNNIAIRCVVYRQPGHRGSNSTNDK